MANIASSVTSYLLGLLTSAAGLESHLGSTRGYDSSAQPRTLISIQNAAPELVERSTQVTDPAI
jgi:hypothetical protein